MAEWPIKPHSLFRIFMQDKAEQRKDKAEQRNTGGYILIEATSEGRSRTPFKYVFGGGGAADKVHLPSSHNLGHPGN
jgi:hypothetical protein